MAKLKRVRVWKAADDDKDVDIRLIDSEKAALVAAVMASGEPFIGSRLLALGPNGLARMPNVDPNLGFPLDEHGRIELDES